MLPIR